MTRIISIVGGLQPSTPTIGTATAGDTTASVAFTPSTYIGKGTITYTATSSPGGFTGTASSSPITVSGLTNGTAYTFTVTGTTNYGVTSIASSASNSITPAPSDTGAMFPIFATTLSSTASSITFSNIPSTYTHLQVRFATLNSATGGTFIRLNNDSGTNYSTHYFYGNGTVPQSGGGGGEARIYIANHGTDIPTIGIIDILDYANTNKYKTTRTISGNETNAGNNTAIALWSGNWRSFTAVNAFTIYGDGTNFTANTTVALYGIK